jgi:glutamyl-tRNA synthetase
VTGRFAPSPTGELHLGNLRTALAAWLAARSRGGGFVVRLEDLDRVTSSDAHAARQLADLAAVGLDWDGDVVRQSDRFGQYEEAIARLSAAGRTYECYCTRREIREAASAPHADPAGRPERAYPGRCRGLTDAERAERRRARPPALRLDAGGEAVTVHDVVAGRYTGRVDDVVLRRNDGVPAYNLAVVVDDAAQGITEVVRGDDLLSSTPRQVLLQRLLGLPPVTYVHVPLVVGDDGERLAKRHGAVTLGALAERGVPPGEVTARLARSLGLAVEGADVRPAELVEHFRLAELVALGRQPVRIPV